MVKRSVYLIIVLISFFIMGCSEKVNEPISFSKEQLKSIEPHGIYYEIFIRAFYDSTGDGIGDFKGATSKLDYLQELGVEGVWLMPINPSPSYHGYDVIDYKDVNPEHGTMDDFKEFVEEAQNRGIKVIKDFVVNHSSTEHPWFEAALEHDEQYRDFYVWADENTDLRQRGEWGQLVWHGSGNNIYEGVFWGGMPDLNMDNPQVREKLYDIGRFWLEEVGETDSV
ncbi:glycosidase [Evansella vedderi]|uniref:Glycosidase n=1 Tax=Evansella vedderi TaxID=38282 RepID=A0ABT9ZVX3_9BACI|nr:alpha-amylase family glycosyl hydrolase [Evansella vedderi]MDQ0254618.1 glycosidase [Evansella vedderi]